MDLTEYDALVVKVDAFTAEVTRRCRSQLRCRPGCEACCHVHLSLSPVEAASVSRHLRQLPEEALRRMPARGTDERCVMLEEDGTCAIYEARPLVCRTQGLALRYPPGFVPHQAVRSRLGGGEVTWCPLNFTGRGPEAGEVLDAALVDQLLALVNRRHAEATAQDPLQRIALRSLVPPSPVQAGDAVA